MLEDTEILQTSSEFSEGKWPIPKRVFGFEEFDSIDVLSEFERVISNPKNWQVILENKNLFNKWVAPNAILLFGKKWFDAVKYKNSISMGVPFPLFSKEDRQDAIVNKISIEKTISGRAIITRIIVKTAHTLKKYLQSEPSDLIRSPKNYIIRSLENDMSQKIAKDLGYKSKAVCVCPKCMSDKDNKYKRSLVVSQDPLNYKCTKCSANASNMLLQINKKKKLGLSYIEEEKQYNILKNFSHFIGLSYICPNNNCSGRFIPINFSNINRTELESILSNSKMLCGTQIFKQPPEQLLDVEIKCPFCDVEFTPRNAIEEKTGYKNHGGFITGIPTTFIWKKMEKMEIDCPVNEYEGNNGRIVKDMLVNTYRNIDEDIIVEQKLNLIVCDLILKISKLSKKNIRELTSLYFYLSAIKWIKKYPKDAYNYFFEWKTNNRELTEGEKEKGLIGTKKYTKIILGQEIAIHKSLFQIWIDTIEENISDFTKVNKNIVSLKDLGWFCRPPKYYGGPVCTFCDVVSDNKISNKVTIIGPNGTRIAKVYSVYKIVDWQVDKSINYVNSIVSSDWQTLEFNKDLNDGDVVEVEALMMSGHMTHTPIQRILRLRSLILHDFVVKIMREEETGEVDVSFWKEWKSKVKKAKQLVNEKLVLDI